MTFLRTVGRFEGLHWQSEGAGPLCLVMHGGLGFDHQYLRPWLDPLAEHRRVVYYDHRGNGQSDEPPDWHAVSHATWIEDADRLRDHLGAESMVLVGHSYGGVLAQEYALRYPERLDALILCATYPSFAHAPVALANAAARGTPEQLAVLAEGLSAPSPSDAQFARDCRTILPLYFHRPTSAHLAALQGVRFRVQAFNRAFFHCLPTFSAIERLGDIRVPTLVVSGDDDWIAPVDHAARPLQEGIPGTELAVIPDAGHFPFIEEPEAFNRAVSAWLTRTLGARASSATRAVP